MSVFKFFFFVVLLAIDENRFAIVCAGGEPTVDESKNKVTPLIDDCKLEYGGFSQKQILPSSADPLRYKAAGLELAVTVGDVRAFRGTSTVPTWVASAPDSSKLSWLGSDDATGYVVVKRLRKDGENQLSRVSDRLHRLDLVTGRWLDELPLSRLPELNRVESVLDLLLAEGRVILLVEFKAAKGRDSKLAGYRVVCFKNGQVQPIWSKEFESVLIPRSQEALLFATGSPDKVNPHIRMLNSLGRDVLVCAGPTEDLVSLAGSTGEQKWRIPRVWEYKRGFIGPSIWQHTMGRDSPEILQDKQDKATPAVDRWHAIVGGPIVVAPDGTEKPHIFVAVSNGPAEYSQYLSDCVVYEFASDGRALGMVSIPRMVRGRQVVITRNGVVWACAGGGFVCIAPSEDPESKIGIGKRLGGTDRVCNVEWYRSLRPSKVKAWLTADPAIDSVAFGPGWAVRARSGGYVLTKESKEYRFPLSLVDLSTGAERDMELHVPLSGRVSEPESNFRRTTDEKENDQWHVIGPHLLGITGLAGERDRLRITLGMADWARTLVFEVPESKSK